MQGLRRKPLRAHNGGSLAGEHYSNPRLLVDIVINLDGSSPSYHRGRELAKALLLAGSRPEAIGEVCEEALREVLDQNEASILASVIYHLEMVSVGLKRALELDEDLDFVKEVTEGIWLALEQAPLTSGRSYLKLGGDDPGAGGTGKEH